MSSKYWNSIHKKSATHVSIPHLGSEGLLWMESGGRQIQLYLFKKAGSSFYYWTTPQSGGISSFLRICNLPNFRLWLGQSFEKSCHWFIQNKTFIYRTSSKAPECFILYYICYIILSSIKNQPWFSVNFRVCNMKLFIVFLAGFLASLSCNTQRLHTRYCRHISSSKTSY